MSYTIERTKRVLVLPHDLIKAAGYADIDLHSTLLFVSASACNNVYPRTYDWNVIATGGYSRWNDEIMLPDAIWRSGHDADGGGVKCYGRGDVTGVAYIRQWKKAALCARSIVDPDGRALWLPRVTIFEKDWHRSKPRPMDLSIDGFATAYARENGDADVANLSGYDLERIATLYGSFKRLFPDPARTGWQDRRQCKTLNDLLDAVRLYARRPLLPFTICLSDDDYSPFLCDSSAFVPATWDYVRDPAVPSKQVATIEEVMAA